MCTNWLTGTVCDFLQKSCRVPSQLTTITGLERKGAFEVYWSGDNKVLFQPRTIGANHLKLKRVHTPSQILFCFIFKFLSYHTCSAQWSSTREPEWCHCLLAWLYFLNILQCLFLVAFVNAIQQQLSLFTLDNDDSELFFYFLHPVSCRFCTEPALQMRNKCGDKLTCLSMLPHVSFVKFHWHVYFTVGARLDPSWTGVCRGVGSQPLYFFCHYLQ